MDGAPFIGTAEASKLVYKQLSPRSSCDISVTMPQTRSGKEESIFLAVESKRSDLRGRLDYIVSSLITIFIYTEKNHTNYIINTVIR